MSNLNEQQLTAIEYLRYHNVDLIIPEMLHTAVTENESQPIYTMIKYLANTINKQDKSLLEKEGITFTKDISFDNYSPLIKDFYLPDDSTLILKRFIQPKVYEKLKQTKTKLGGHISHLIQAALKLDSKETVGILATDGECYDTMDVLFKPAIEFLHNYDKDKSLFYPNNPNGLDECINKKPEVSIVYVYVYLLYKYL